MIRLTDAPERRAATQAFFTALVTIAREQAQTKTPTREVPASRGSGVITARAGIGGERTSQPPTSAPYQNAVRPRKSPVASSPAS